MDWIREREGYSKDTPIRLAFIGDRVFTDVLYANKNNFLSILATRTVSLKNESKVITKVCKNDEIRLLNSPPGQSYVTLSTPC